MKDKVIKWIYNSLKQEQIDKLDIQMLLKYDERVFATILTAPVEIRFNLLSFFASVASTNRFLITGNSVYDAYQENREKIVKIGKIIKRGKRECRKYAEKVARIQGILGREDAPSIVQSVAQAKYPTSAELCLALVLDKDFLAREDALAFINLVTNAEESWKAYYAKFMIHNTGLLKMENAFDFMQYIINESHDEYTTMDTITPFIVHEEFMEHPQFQMLVRGIVDGTYQEEFKNYLKEKEIVIGSDNIKEALNQHDFASLVSRIGDASKTYKKTKLSNKP